MAAAAVAFAVTMAAAAVAFAVVVVIALYVRIVGQLQHAGLVAQQRAARSRGRGVDRKHGHTVALRGQQRAQCFAEGTLTGSWRTSDSKTERTRNELVRMVLLVLHSTHSKHVVEEKFCLFDMAW